MQRELVERAILGDHDAFSVLARASIGRLYAIATLILRDGDRAQDAVQEALVSAWRDVRAIRDPEAWDAWLHRLTVRACYKVARRERRRDLVELHVTPDEEPVEPTDMSMRLAERDRLERELGRLPIDQRAVMVLHFYFDLPLTEAAVDPRHPRRDRQVPAASWPPDPARIDRRRVRGHPRRQRHPGADRMNTDTDLQRQVTSVFADAAPSGYPDELLTRVLSTTSRTRPRPTWLANIKEPPMRYPSTGRRRLADAPARVHRRLDTCPDPGRGRGRGRRRIAAARPAPASRRSGPPATVP